MVCRMPVQPPSDRRPIAARDTRWADTVAAFLIRRGASPDAISVAGAVAACLAGALIAVTPGVSDLPARACWLAGAGLVQLRLLCNLFDGMVAVGRGTASRRGELFNELPDRVSDTAVLCGVGVAAGQGALGLGAALAALVTAYIRAVGRGLGAGSDFAGPMAKQQRMAVVTALSVLVAVLPAAWSAGFPAAALWLVLLGSLLTAGRRLLRLWRAL